jgi:hypothetical protein
MTDSASKLEGSRLKIERAYCHINELNACMIAFNKTEFCTFSIQEDSSTGHQIAKINALGKPPSKIPVIVGDVVHNLKAALDFIAFQATKYDRIYFPKYKNREDSISSSELRLIKEAAPDLASYIADTVQPYEGGNYRVWETATLNNLDKHRILIPTLTVTAISHVSLIDENNNHTMVERIVVAQGGELKIPSGFGIKRLKIARHGKPTADIFFGKGDVFQNQPIIPTLTQIAEAFTRIIETAESLLSGDSA